MSKRQYGDSSLVQLLFMLPEETKCGGQQWPCSFGVEHPDTSAVLNDIDYSY
jgi:hypothetical protein